MNTKIPNNILYTHLIRTIVLFVIVVFFILFFPNAPRYLIVLIPGIFLNEILKYFGATIVYKYGYSNLTTIGTIFSLIEGVIYLFLVSYLPLLPIVGIFILALLIIVNTLYYDSNTIIIQGVVISIAYFFLNLSIFTISKDFIYYLLGSSFLLIVSIVGYFSTLRSKIVINTAEKKINASDVAESENVKDEFIIIVSHTLRTPIAAIRGYLQLLDGTEDPQIRNNYLNQLKTNVNKLADIIEEVVGVLTIGTRKETEPLNLTLAIKESIDSFAIVAQSKNITINFESKGQIPDIAINANRFKIILNNIIDNAVKYSYNNSKIDIYLSADTNSVYISVQDYGVGIDRGELSSIFTKFHKSSDVMVSNFSGVGLGLYLVKTIVDLELGSISVKSEKGKGAEFTIKFPTSNILSSLEKL